MNNKEFESYIYNLVNGNAKTASEARNAQFLEEARKWVERRKAQKRRAIIEMLCLVLVFFATVVAMWTIGLMGLLPIELVVLIPALFGAAVGFRVCSLLNVI